MRELGWTKQQLVDRSKVPRDAGVLVVARVPPRGVGRDDVSRLALALALGLEEKTPGRGHVQLEGLLNELLGAAGYSAMLGRRQDLIWNRLTDASRADRELRVGWYRMYNFAEHVESGGSERVEGIAVRITEEVFRHLGVRIRWVYLPLPEQIPALRRARST